MGQRHQIYFVLPFEVENKEDKVKLNVVGLHNQWLYGVTALECLDNALNFITKQDKYGPLVSNLNDTEAANVCAMLYSVNPSTGYYHYIHQLGEAECTNPDNGDNNDGITIIDVRDKDNVKYCFMFLDKHKPISASEYVGHYYGDEWLKGVINDESEKYKRGNPDATQKDIASHMQKEMAECADWQNHILEIAKAIDSKASLLSPEEVTVLFPKMMCNRNGR